MTYNMATINENLKYGKHYGYDIPKDVPFSFGEFVHKRQARIKVLNGVYETNWAKEGIELIKGTATFIDKNTMEVDLKDGSGKMKGFKSKLSDDDVKALVAYVRKMKK